MLPSQPPRPQRKLALQSPKRPTMPPPPMPMPTSPEPWLMKQIMATLEQLPRRQSAPPAPVGLQASADELLRIGKVAEKRIERQCEHVRLRMARRRIDAMLPIRFEGSKNEGGVDVFLQPLVAAKLCSEVGVAFKIVNELLMLEGYLPLSLAIEGHTSASIHGHEESITISTKRAGRCMEEVVSWLAASDAVSLSQMITHGGYGCTQPLPWYDDGSNHEENRRVEFRLVEPHEAGYCARAAQVITPRSPGPDGGSELPQALSPADQAWGDLSAHGSMKSAVDALAHQQHREAPELGALRVPQPLYRVSASPTPRVHPPGGSAIGSMPFEGHSAAEHVFGHSTSHGLQGKYRQESKHKRGRSRPSAEEAAAQLAAPEPKNAWSEQTPSTERPGSRSRVEPPRAAPVLPSLPSSTLRTAAVDGSSTARARLQTAPHQGRHNTNGDRLLSAQDVTSTHGG